MSGFLCSMVGASFAVAGGAPATRTARTLTAVGNAQLDTAQKKFGSSAMLFDGAGDCVRTDGTSDFLFSTNFTIEFQLRFAAISTLYVPLCQRPGSGVGVGDWWCEVTAAENKMYWGFQNTAGTQYYVNLALAGTAFAANTWYHIALVCNSNVMQFYVNGTAVGTTTSVTGTFGSSSLPITIGALGDVAAFSYSLNGWIDELRISNVARYTANFAPPSALFENDPNTLLLIHADGADASTTITDDTTGPGATDSISSFGVSYPFSQYAYDKISYAGLDSSSRPVYLFGYADYGNSYYPTVVLFRVNSDLSITAGASTVVYSEASNSTVAAADPDNGYGVVLQVKNEEAGAFMKAFTINKDALTIGTPGTSLEAYAASGAAALSIDYAGGGRFHIFHRRNGDNASHKYVTRSGTTLTLSSTEILTNFGSQVYTQIRAFTASGSLYRTVVSGNNTNPQAQAYYWNNTTGSTVSSATAISWTSMSGIVAHPLCRLSPADKFLLTTYNNSGSVQMAAGTVTWPSSGTTAPTISAGTALSLTDASIINGTADGFGNDEAYYLYRKLSTNELYWRKITSSGTTLTQGSANLLTASGANLVSNQGILLHGVQAFSKKLLVGLTYNNSKAATQVIVTQVT